ncbi:MAG: BspA family leucine-rich repeat surface protein [Firmicutes bacterium]|nr:BspA family leucine-rich repeat surface protein [Bacillota bacterium]
MIEQNANNSKTAYVSSTNYVLASSTVNEPFDRTLFASWTLNESYLLKDWQTPLINNNANFTAANIKTIQFVKSVPSGSGYTQVSVGATTSAGTTAFVSGTAGVSDVIAYVKANSSDSTKYDIIFYSPVTIYAPVDSSHLFNNTTYADLTNLTSITFGNFNTSNVTNMNAMFIDCASLTSLNLSNFNTSNVTDMSAMFSRCSKLTELDVSSFNTSNVTDMAAMFNSCSLTSLNLSNFNTSKVTDMYRMFYSCSKLTSLNLSSFDMSKVTDTRDMFTNCSGLTEIKTPRAIGSTDIKIPNNDWYNTSTLSGPYSSITSSLTGITIKRGCYTFTGTNVRAYRSASVVGASTGYISSGGLIYYGDTVDLIAAIGYAYYGSQSYLCYQTTTAKQWTNYGSNFISLDYTTRVRSGETIASGLTVGGNILAEGTRSYSWINVLYNYRGAETGICGAGEDVTLNWSGLDQGGSTGVKISQFVSNGAKVKVNVRVTFGTKKNQSGSASRWIELGNSTTLNPVHASWKASITVSVSTSGVSFSFRNMGSYHSYGYIDHIQVWV